MNEETKKILLLLKDGELDDLVKALDNLPVSNKYKKEVIGLQASYNQTKRSHISGEVSHSKLRKILSKTSNKLYALITQDDFLLETRLSSSFLYSKDLGWMKFQDSLDTYSRNISHDFNNAQTDLDRENILKKVAQIYFDAVEIYGYEIPKEFINLFDERVVKNPLYHFSGVDLYESLIGLFKSGIPEIPHFYGLTSIKSDDLFETPGLLIFFLALTSINKEGFNHNAISFIKDKGLNNKYVLNFPPLYYLIGQCYRKSNFFVEAISYFNAGVSLIENIIKPTIHNLLVLAELYRGIASVYRKKAAKIMDELEYTRIEEFYKKSLVVTDQIKTQYPKLNQDDLIAFNKVLSDILFSYGYFEFEYFFNKASTYEALDPKGAQKILAKFKESNRLHPTFTAPISRMALLQLYCNQFEKSASSFYNVYESDRIYLKTRNDQERKLTLIWTSIAIFLLNKYFKITFQEVISIDEIKSHLNSAIKEPLSISTVQCHLNDTEILLKIFTEINKIDDVYIQDILLIKQDFVNFYKKLTDGKN